MTQITFARAENMLENGEQAGNQHFLMFPQCFHKTIPSLFLKLLIVLQKVTDDLPTFDKLAINPKLK